MSKVLDLESARTGRGKPKTLEEPDALWCRREALQIVAQLPHDKAMALAVLVWAQRLVMFINDGAPDLPV